MSKGEGAEAPFAREVVHADAMVWLAENRAKAATSVVTSLPDVSEVPALGLSNWRAWFVDAAQRVIRWVPDDGLAIFYQSDVRAQGTWVDKSYLVMRAAEHEGAQLVFHKIVCRKPPGTITHGRASYSHLICVSPKERGMPRHPGPDVLLDAGYMPWSKAMGVNACVLACRFLREESKTTLVVDPFCGHGTVLAVANAMGFHALGVDLSARQVRAAKRLRIDLEPRGPSP